ncbi:hypothetical protein CC80DRAFT_487646 [Byssothecium circinans]|uniref:Uncharacterized protein n=1 Tax=Byssothecium circinans TaxID=147558 RepID=A0A6A5UDS3_9PLEO|nr:hypothetical protein CC80DRAFT_487646 [Byssothecium circinans]
MACDAAGIQLNPHQRESLATDFVWDMQLLKDVRPVFTHASSRTSGDGCILFIGGRLVELKLQLQPFQIPCDLSRIADDELRTCSRYLSSILSSLDGLLSDKILDYPILSKRKGQLQGPNQKLVAIKDLMSFRYKASSDPSNRKQSGEPYKDGFSSEVLATFVDFDIGFSEAKALASSLT